MAEKPKATVTFVANQNPIISDGGFTSVGSERFEVIERPSYLPQTGIQRSDTFMYLGLVIIIGVLLFRKRNEK